MIPSSTVVNEVSSQTKSPSIQNLHLNHLAEISEIQSGDHEEKDESN